MKTSEDFLYEQNKNGFVQGEVFCESYFEEPEIKKAMIEFAKYHVQESFEKAREGTRIDHEIYSLFVYDLNKII